MGRQDAARAIIVLFPCISAIFVGLRCWSRYLGRNFGWDDGLMVVAMFLAIGESISGYGCEKPVIATIGVESGCWFPFHAPQVLNYTPAQLVDINHWSFSYQMFYHPLMGITRMSIVLFLIRIGDVRRHIRWTLYVVLALNIGYIFGTTLANLLQCNPVRYAWSRAIMDQFVDGNYIPGGKCIETLQFVLTSCALSIFMDLILFPVPTMMVWGLNIPRRTKFAVGGVMSLGLIATGVSVGRFVVYYRQFSPSKTVITYNIGHTISIAEANTAIWAGCAPALRRLFGFLFPNMIDSYGAREYKREVTVKVAQEDSAEAATASKDSSAPTNSSRKSKPKDVDAVYPMDQFDSEFGSKEHIATTATVPGRTQSTRTGVSDRTSTTGSRQAL